MKSVSNVRWPCCWWLCYLMWDRGILVSDRMVSYRTLTRNARFSRIARTTWALVVVGFRPINVVAALSSLMGACNTENTHIIDVGLQHTEYIHVSISLMGAYKTQNIIFYVHLSLMGALYNMQNACIIDRA